MTRRRICSLLVAACVLATLTMAAGAIAQPACGVSGTCYDLSCSADAIFFAFCDGKPHACGDAANGYAGCTYDTQHQITVCEVCVTSNFGSCTSYQLRTCAPEPDAGCHDECCSAGGGGSPPPGMGGAQHDPVDMMRGESYARIEDARIPDVSGDLTLIRRYDSSWTSWASDHDLTSVPKPFGSSPSFAGSLHWSHNWYAFADISINGTVLVHDDRARFMRFGACADVGCFAGRMYGGTSSAERLQKTANGWRLFKDNGTRLVFEAAWDTSIWELVSRYFLSRVEDSQGNTIATVSYALPSGLTCPTGYSSGGVPYVSEVTAASGAKLVFDYSARTPTGSSTAECVLTGVRLIGAGGTAPGSSVATYSYLMDGSSIERPGLLATAAYNGITESYSYSGSEFSQSRESTPVFRHQLSGGRVSEVDATDEIVALAYDGGTSCQTGSACCGQTPQVTFETYLSARAGDGTDGGAGYTRRVETISNWGQTLDKRIYRTVDSCSASGACSPGSEQNEWVCTTMDSSTGLSPGHPKASKDKRDNWTTWTYGTHRAPSLVLGLEQTSERKGATDMNGTGALETERYTYVYGTNEQQLRSTEERDSLLTPDAGAGVLYVYDGLLDGGTTRKMAEIHYGWTQQLDGTTVQRFIGTFDFDCQIPSSGSCSGQTRDSAGRTLARHGPCLVSGLTATYCDVDTNYPVTKYTYYGVSSATTSGKLQKVSRYPNGTSGTSLDTTYNSYDAFGNATSITDEAGVTTTYSYTNNLLTQKVVNSSETTNFGYENRRLSWVQMPEGNYEVYCYRSGTTSGCSGGTLTNLLQWKAKASSSSGSTWSERVDYSYWPDGTPASETYSLPGPTVRRVLHYAADAHKRRTWEQQGDTSGQFTSAWGYDRANNVAGVGFAYNSPPAWCGAPTSGAPDTPTSKLCAHLSYDRANRLETLEEYPISTATTPDKSCFLHDGHGNLTKVISGCQTTVACTDGNGNLNSSLPSSCTAMAIDYSFDDFHNLLSVTAPNSGDTSRGVARMEYDARANLVKKQTDAQRNAATAVWTVYAFDELNRPTSASAVNSGGAVTLWSKSYDSVTLPSNCGSSLTYGGGRVVREIDATGASWFSYDFAGRLTRVIRSKGNDGATSCSTGVDSLLTTSYGYNSNGAVTSITYPHGRIISYTFDSTTQSKDRVRIVSMGLTDGGTQTLIQNATWEPYGGLRAYEFVAPTASSGSQVGSVEYLAGASESSLTTPLTYPETAESNDHSGRLRQLRVSTGSLPSTGNSSAGDIYRKGYQWSADQLLDVRTSYKDTSVVLDEQYPRTATEGFDQRLRLLQVNASATNWTFGAEYSRRKFDYDGRSNRRDNWAMSTPRASSGSEIIDGCGESDGLQYASASHLKDELSHWSSCAQAYTFDFDYDRDGRVTAKKWRADSSGDAGYRLDFDYGLTASASTPDPSLVFKSVSVNGSLYSYFYDADGKRLRKDYPSALKDDFYYGQNKELLEDRGNKDSVTEFDVPLDEYIWLDSRPVAFIRSKFNSSWVRQPDFSGTCTRLGEDMACGAYFLVTDHIGKPVLLVDSNRKIAGAMEFDPFGNVNVQQHAGATATPYAPSQNTDIDAMTMHAGTNMVAKVRFVFNALDTEASTGTPTCNQPTDYVVINDINGNALTPHYGGYHQGQLRTAWFDVPANPYMAVHFVSNGGNNCAPGVCTGSCGASSFPYTGVVDSAFEYRRYEPGANVAWTPLRFPGQYFDAETDLHENWNRFYDPLHGRYLQPEPMMASVAFLADTAKQGRSVITYAYADDRPLSVVDVDGRKTSAPGGGFKPASCTDQCGWDRAQCREQERTGQKTREYTCDARYDGCLRNCERYREPKKPRPAACQ